MLILRSSVFLHVPKTGGSWIRQAIRAAGVPCAEYIVDGDPHAPLADCPCPEKFKFAFVRHPVALYRSYWRYKMDVGWDARNPFDIDCAAQSFDQFVRNVLRNCPGWCSRMFEDYVGTMDREIEFVGRFERLVEDVICALRRSGEEFDETMLRRTPRANASVTPQCGARGSSDLVDAIRAAECEAFTRFGYLQSSYCDAE
jgi:hypothetical protein